MRRSTPVVVVLLGMLGVGCLAGQPPPKAAPPDAPAPDAPAPASVPPTPATSVAPLLDDPKSCIDPSVETLKRHQAEIHAEIRRQLDAALPELSGCQGTLSRHETIELSLKATPEGVETWIHGTSLGSCEIVDCVRKRLGKISVPADAGPYATGLLLNLELDPHQAPSVALPEDTPGQPWRPSFPNSTCTAGSPPRLAPGVVSTALSKHSRRLKSCYGAGVARHPLEGRMNVKFVIGRDGKVSSAIVTENEIPDCAVVECLRASYMSLEFPKPTDGTVTVQSPIALEKPR